MLTKQDFPPYLFNRRSPACSSISFYSGTSRANKKKEKKRKGKAKYSPRACLSPKASDNAIEKGPKQWQGTSCKGGAQNFLHLSYETSSRPATTWKVPNEIDSLQEREQGFPSNAHLAFNCSDLSATWLAKALAYQSGTTGNLVSALYP